MCGLRYIFGRRRKVKYTELSNHDKESMKFSQKEKKFKNQTYKQQQNANHRAENP